MTLKLILSVIFINIHVLATQQVLFIHGNTEDSSYWTDTENSLSHDVEKVVDESNVFYANYLTEEEINNPVGNYHRPLLYERIKKTIDKMHGDKITIVAHSFGVTLTLATLEYYKLWGRVKKIVAFAGALRGLESCKLYGPYNTFVPTCYGQSKNDPYVFGFYPGTARNNSWMGPLQYAFRNMPRRYPSVDFHSVSIGVDDVILCRDFVSSHNCYKTALFNEYGQNSRNYIFEGEGLDHFQLPHNTDRTFALNLILNE